MSRRNELMYRFCTSVFRARSAANRSRTSVNLTKPPSATPGGHPLSAGSLEDSRAEVPTVKVRASNGSSRGEDVANEISSAPGAGVGFRTASTGN
jgi:hypothetical protein